MEKEKNGLSQTALIMGIIAIVTCFIPIINNISIILGILSVIFGIIGLVKKTNAKTKTIIAIILGLLSLIIAVSLQAEWAKSIDELSDDFSEMTGDKTKEILGNDVEVSFSDFKVISGEWSDKTKLAVTVKNISSEKSSYSISVEAVDENGNRIDDDDIYVSDLAAGQSQTFDAFTYVSDDDIELLKVATFKVIEISKY